MARPWVSALILSRGLNMHAEAVVGARYTVCMGAWAMGAAGYGAVLRSAMQCNAGLSILDSDAIR